MQIGCSLSSGSLLTSAAVDALLRKTQIVGNVDLSCLATAHTLLLPSSCVADVVERSASSPSFKSQVTQRMKRVFLKMLFVWLTELTVVVVNQLSCADQQTVDDLSASDHTQ